MSGSKVYNCKNDTRTELMFVILVACFAGTLDAHLFAQIDKSPNILLVMGEDMSSAHLSAYEERAIKTPVFDQLSQEGILFSNAYCSDSALEAVRKIQRKLMFLHGHRPYQGVLHGTGSVDGKTHQAKIGLVLYDLRRDLGERYEVQAD